MDIKQFLDSTYLKTPEQAKISQLQNTVVVQQCIDQAIQEQFKLIMIRPQYVTLARTSIDKAKSNVLVGTVISFPEGTNTLQQKITQAQQAIHDGADELDFVLNYQAFKAGDLLTVKQEILKCAQLVLSNKKTIKFIIEVAALTDTQIIEFCTLIKNTIIANFSHEYFSCVFVKSSTGFYPTPNNTPNGATIHTITLMLENASPLLVKAAGGVRTQAEALAMIGLGVKRIGTSAAKQIVTGNIATNNY